MIMRSLVVNFYCSAENPADSEAGGKRVGGNSLAVFRANGCSSLSILSESFLVTSKCTRFSSIRWCSLNITVLLWFPYLLF